MNKNWLLKGDVSGIQEFIFSTTSKRAARTLKARSWYIKAICEICGKEINEIFHSNNVDEIYNGGGNFYYDVKNTNDFEQKIKELQTRIDKDLKHDEIYLALSWVGYNEETENGFKNAWDTMKTESSLKKLQRFKNTQDDFFTPFQYKEKESDISHDTLQKTDKKFLDKSIKNIFNLQKEGINNKLPNWNRELLGIYDDIIKNSVIEGEDNPKIKEPISFNYLAEFAKHRTGSAKLGILKMDVDNLSTYFDSFNNKIDATKLSELLSKFFDKEIYDLLKSGDENAPEALQNNIYPIFSGGDDCFFVGAYDSIFSFAKLVNEQFAEILKKEGFVELVEKINKTRVKEGKTTIKQTTISAGLIVVDAHFPVVRFAQFAEEALEDAKKYAKGDNKKNAISVFGEVLTWKDNNKVSDLKKSLLELIEEKRDYRTILERIKDSAIGFENLQNRAIEGNISFPKIWRLKHFLRNVKNNENRERIDKEIFTKYEEALIQTYSNPEKATNPMIFPVAARYTELLTRKKQ